MEYLLTLWLLGVLAAIGCWWQQRSRPENIADGQWPSERGLHGR